MDVVITPATPEQGTRKRSKSAFFKSFVTPRSRPISPVKQNIGDKASKEGATSRISLNEIGVNDIALPPDHPVNRCNILGELHANSQQLNLPCQYSLNTQIFSTSQERLGNSKRKIDTDESSSAKVKMRRQKEDITPSHSAERDDGKKIPSHGSAIEYNHLERPVMHTEQSHDICRSLVPPSECAGSGLKMSLERLSSKPRSMCTTDARSTDSADGTASKRELSKLANQKHCPPGADDGPSDLNDALEEVLEARNIAEHMRKHVRGLDSKIKADLVRHSRAHLSRRDVQPPVALVSYSDRSESPSIQRGRTGKRHEKRSEKPQESTSPTKQARTSSKNRPFGMGDRSPSKKPRSLSRPRSLMSLKNLSSSSLVSFGFDGSKDSKEQSLVSKASNNSLKHPGDFAIYLEQVQEPSKVEVGKLHKLRILTRNESVRWIDEFVMRGGMSGLLTLLKRIMSIEWREEHDDLVLQEVLQCLKGLCTTDIGIHRLAEVESTLFPELLRMIFDEERKGPSEYGTRGIVISLMFMQLSAARTEHPAEMSYKLLRYLADQTPPEERAPLDFIQDMRRSRPYQTWHKEIYHVTKEVFWIFLHHGNVIRPSSPDMNSDDIEHYSSRHFPKARPPVAAAPFVGGVEWDATNYLATHLDLMNGLIATTPTLKARNHLREDLKASGFEKIMGKTLRTCKEKFYPAVHEALRTWIAAAIEDEWPVRDVQSGPVAETAVPKSPTKSPVKGLKTDVPPKLELPKLDIENGVGLAISGPQS